MTEQTLLLMVTVAPACGLVTYLVAKLYKSRAWFWVCDSVENRWWTFRGWLLK